MLRSLQRLLEIIYDAPSDHDVRDFLVTERCHLPAERRVEAAEEELVLVEQRHQASLMLYIDSAVLGRLREHDPLRALDSGNIADFWTALEGVSHFSCLMWNAGHTRGISLLDLELQAEVDKYITSFWLCAVKTRPTGRANCTTRSSCARTLTGACRRHASTSMRRLRDMRRGSAARCSPRSCRADRSSVGQPSPRCGASTA